MSNDLTQLLQSASPIELTPSPELDLKIKDIIYNTKTTKSFFSVRALLFSLSVFIIFVIINHIFYPGYLYNNVMASIIKAQEEKNVDKALNLYSQEFFKRTSRRKVKDNIQKLFAHYKKIDYIPEKEKVILKNNNLLIENKVYYHADPKDREISPITFKGKERIYLKKESQGWKVFAWIYDM
ncbi:MAG: hypothetical protein JW827_09355 [Spirochaetes bacterium]|nr:hypothetical protein [Spirochaetota bacterium]